MLTAEQNRLLTETGPGTPGGGLLRRYWQPVALARELPPGGAPLPVRILGEDLVLFRDEAGRPGLLGLHCPHRGTDLSFGRLEDGGLRCIYHGWLFDVAGRCLEQPGEPAGSDFRDRVRQRAYPCREAGDLIMTYMGPGEPPLLPAYAYFAAPEGYRFASKFLHQCNYLQGNEGNIDPVHLSFLHQIHAGDGRGSGPRVAAGSSESPFTLLRRDTAPTIEIEETGFGLRVYTIREAGDGRRYVRITNFIMPNLSAFGGPSVESGGYSLNWHVPVDDAQHWKYQLYFSRSRPLDLGPLREKEEVEQEAPFRLRRKLENHFLQDREEMRATTFSGVGPSFVVHDAVAVASQGPVQDRTAEHLGYTDKAITAARHQLLDGIRDVQAGRDPRHVARSQDANDLSDLVVYHRVVPASVDWRHAWRQPAPAG